MPVAVIFDRKFIFAYLAHRLRRVRGVNEGENSGDVEPKNQ